MLKAERGGRSHLNGTGAAAATGVDKEANSHGIESPRKCRRVWGKVLC
jgi:hypothetical protein